MTLRVSVAAAVATITIDNPAKRNAMTAGMWRQLPVILKDLQNLSPVRVVVVTGAAGTFCAGADISAMTSAPAGQHAASPPGEPTTAAEMAQLAVLAEEALASFPKPTIARIEGDCVGGGCQLAIACDLRLAAAGARFGITPARLGVIYPAASTARLVHTLGLAHAKWLLLTAELATAQDALRMGLVHEVAGDPGDLDDRVARTAATLASRSLLSQAAAKEIMGMAAYGVDAARVHHWWSLMRESGEAAEGTAAFLERRPPSFPWSP